MPLKTYAGSSEITELGEEQVDEKQELEKMRQELNDIKGSIKEGLAGISKVDTNALKNLQEFHLICKSARCEISPGKTVDCLTYNGILPGPTIRVKEGQLVRLIVHNQLNTPTSLHIHGMVLPASVDGIPNTKTGLIQPGQTYVYQFIAKPVGTYWYHPQIIHADQKSKGLYGALIVEPAGAPVKSVDQDLVLVLSDIAGGSHSIFYLINGKTAPAIPAIEVSQDSRIRLRLINCGQHAVPLHISGHKFEVVALNGNLVGEQTERDTITLGVSDRLDLEFTANNPGVWSLGSELVEQSSNDGQFPGGIACVIKYIDR